MPSDTPIKPVAEVIHAVDKLPPLPRVVAQLNDMIHDPEISVEAIVRVISFDQSLTATILRLVNSAYYALQRQVSTIRHALIILGFDEIRQIILGTTMINLFASQENHTGFDIWKFWEHSLSCAFAAKNIARAFHYRVTGEIFVAGLLHDIGKIILEQYFPDEFDRIQSQVLEYGLSPLAAEKERIGMDHGELGHLLADHWNMPYPIVETIRYHHDPAESKQDSLTAALIHLADFVAIQNGFDTGPPWNMDPTIDPKTWDLLKKRKLDLNETDLDRFAYELVQCQGQIHEFLEDRTP
jgi:putative nucleotidyltransferase with HDIG domain